MTRTIHDITNELDCLKRDTAMSTSLWMEVYIELMHELRDVHNAFDYDELIENAHYEDVQNHLQRAIEDEYDRQWSMPLHPWAWRVIAVWFVVGNIVGLVALWAR